jgi:alpha-D-ribose 1-methylphosphonate 5-phosphate C-P lyase
MIRTLDKQRKINFARAALEGVAAGFVGLLMLFMCDEMGMSKQWTGVIVGVAGWMGPSATMRVLDTIIRRRLNIKLEEPK